MAARMFGPSSLGFCTRLCPFALAFALKSGGGVYIHAERLLAKAGEQAQGEGDLPSLERSDARVERTERSGGLHKRSAETWGWGRGGRQRRAPRCLLFTQPSIMVSDSAKLRRKPEMSSPIKVISKGMYEPLDGWWHNDGLPPICAN